MQIQKSVYEDVRSGKVKLENPGNPMDAVKNLYRESHESEKIKREKRVQSSTHMRSIHKKPVKRNSQCPCGSGKKFKKCCGK